MDYRIGSKVGCVSKNRCIPSIAQKYHKRIKICGIFIVTLLSKLGPV